MSFVSSLHTHVRSLFDADIDLNALCERIKALGGKSCAITDHGVVSTIEDARHVFSEHGLKLIPGVELYVTKNDDVTKRNHLVLLAVNDNGWKGICQIVTESNKSLESKGKFPAIREDVLFDIIPSYKGDIIALSACMLGVINTVFLSNEDTKEKIKKVQIKQSKYTSPESGKLSDAEKAVSQAEAEYQRLIAVRDDLKLLAEQKFAAREKRVSELEKTFLKEEYESAKALLENDKNASLKAKNDLEKVKNDISIAKKAISSAKKYLREVSTSVESYYKYEVQIQELQNKMRTPEDIRNDAVTELVRYCALFGEGNFYAEMQYHGIPEEAICFPYLAELARSFSIPLVATNDVHILTNSPNDILRRQTARSLRFGKGFEEASISDKELYLKTDEELKDALLKILPEEYVNEAISNIKIISDRCNVSFETGEHHPKAVLPDGMSADDLLLEKVNEGIKWRFPDGMDDIHKARLENELVVIKKMGYSDYHLVVQDFLEYGRLLGYVPQNMIQNAPLTIGELKEYIKANDWSNPGFRTGPGRGSAVGSLVCYLLGITALDPIKYGLKFERYLNTERVTMPDIDSDFSADTRQKVIDYVKNKYGVESVCSIMTQTFLGVKGSIACAAKYYGLKNYGKTMTSKGHLISKSVPDINGITFDTRVTNDGKAPEGEELTITTRQFLDFVYASDKDALAIIEWANVIEGIFTSYGAHAAGIVLSDGNPVSNYLPLRMNVDINAMTTQCDMTQVEENGLLKFDFLGLKTLDIITETLFSIEREHGLIINPLNIPLDDKMVYRQIFSAGKTTSVFQFESDGMKSMLRKARPDRFEDLIMLVATYRPGPMQYLDSIIKVKSGAMTAEYLPTMEPFLKPILSETYGSIVYQEQVMDIFQKCAGYTLGGADLVRRAMSKKKLDKLTKERNAFIYGDPSRAITGCLANGISEESANKLFDQLTDFASYAFNKSHAAAYAYNAYITAWLKYYYPAEFFTAALNYPKNNTTIPKLLHEIAQYDKIKLCAPDINKSQKNFTVEHNEITFGLASIAGVKDNSDVIIKERQENGVYLSVPDFLTRVKPKKDVLNALIGSGCLDSFHKNRKALADYIAQIQPTLEKIEEKRSFIKSAKLLLPVIESLRTDEDVVNFQKSKGFKAEIKKCTTVEKLEPRIQNAKMTVFSLNREISTCTIPLIHEDRKNRMSVEKELLGAYITEHPMDHYPAPGTYKASYIADIREGDNIRAYGVIQDISIRKSKKSGMEMAFFRLEDRTGSVNVCVFTKAYAMYSSFIKDGNVVLIRGNCQIEKTFDDEEETKVYAEKIESIEEEKPIYLFGTDDYESFVKEKLSDFKTAYEDKRGYELVIYDKKTRKLCYADFRVSPAIKSLPDVEEVKLKV